MDTGYRGLKLKKLGFPESTLSLLAFHTPDPWCTSLTEPQEIPFAKVKHLPLLQVAGFPEDCKEREVRTAVCLMGGFVGMATCIIRGMLVAYIWWTADSSAIYAMFRLRSLRIDPACSGSLDVNHCQRWSVHRDPPAIYP